MGDKNWNFTLKHTTEGDNITFRVEFDKDTSDSGHEFSSAILNTFFTLVSNCQTLGKGKLQEFAGALENIESLKFTFIGDESLYSSKSEFETTQESEAKTLAKTGMGSSATFIGNI